MSLHVQLSPQAIENLRRQRRNTTIASLLLSLVVVALILIVLGLLLLPNMIKVSPTFVTYLPPEVVAEPLDNKRVTTTIKRNPSAPATAINKVIAVSAASSVSIPVPDIDITAPAIDLGDGQDFGGGWGVAGDFGTGAAVGGGGGFGSSNARSGGLKGYIYDLKQTRDGQPLEYTPRTFVTSARKLIESQFNDSAFREYFKAPTPLYLTRLAIPVAPADQGPSFFNAEKEIQPRGWIAHYSGTVIVPKTGTYRFSGGGDDFTHVMIDGKTVFNYFQTLESLDPKSKGYRPEQPSARRRAPFTNANWWVRYGDWVELKAGQQIKLDIAVGETPGGVVGFLLQLEEKGVNYETVSEGNPILPLFTTTPISKKEETELQEQYGNYQLDFENVLVFPLKR